MTGNDNFDALRQQMQTTPAPLTNFESAFLLIENSETTKGLPEVDKEFKLTNLKKEDIELISSLMLSYQELNSSNQSYLDYYEVQQMNSLKDVQGTPEEIALFKESVISELDGLRNSLDVKKFDDCDHLRRALALAGLKRSHDAFERKSQNTVISSNNYSGLPSDPMLGGQSKPGILKRMSGGF